jgi:hypothetical protein
MEVFIMELNLARVVYEPGEPPDTVKPIIERTQVNLPNPLTGPASTQSINLLEATIARDGFMVQVVA